MKAILTYIAFVAMGAAAAHALTFTTAKPGARPAGAAKAGWRS
jgi:hypothetical protein